MDLYTVVIVMVACLLFLGLLFLVGGFSSSLPMRIPPSPPALPVIGHLYLFRKPLHRTLARLAQAYGPIIFLRFGTRPVVVVSSMSLAVECFTKNDVAFANRPHFPSTQHLTYGYKTLGTASYGEYWRKMRRITSNELFSSSRVEDMAGVRAAEVCSLVRSLYLGRGEDGGLRRVDLKSGISGVVLNLVMRMLVGKRYYGDEGVDAKSLNFLGMVERSLAASGASNIADFFPMLGQMEVFAKKKKMTTLEAEWEDFLQGLIDDHRQEDGDAKEERTMMSVLLSLQKEDPKSYSDGIIKALILGLYWAGTDTSSATLEWGMSLLLNNPEAMHKATEEIEAQVGNEQLLSESDLRNLPFLNCIIKETLRLCPPTPLLLPHESLKHCTLGGYEVPPGTMVLVNAHAIQKDPALWEDPNEFRPERFMECGGNEGGKMFFPFGMGRRRCPGEALAVQLVGLVMGALLQCFQWEKEEAVVAVDMGEGAGLTMRKLVPLHAMYRPRKCMADVLSML